MAKVSLDALVKTPSQQNPIHLQRSIREYIWRSCNGVVQTGPFKGMRLEKLMDPNLGTKTLGSYEEELHHPIEREIQRLSALEAPIVVNLGCAQGYYTVGIAIRLPRAMVIGVDIKTDRLRQAHEAAELNGGTVITRLADRFQLEECDFILSDCEGAEARYLDPALHPFLHHTAMLVETHDDTASLMVRRFRATHHITQAKSEQLREPNKYQCLLRLHSHCKWIAVSENRPATHHYLYLVPKDQHQSEG